MDKFFLNLLAKDEIDLCGYKSQSQDDESAKSKWIRPDYSRQTRYLCPNRKKNNCINIVIHDKDNANNINFVFIIIWFTVLFNENW